MMEPFGFVTSLWSSCLSIHEQEILFSKESVTSLESKELPIQRTLGILSMVKCQGSRTVTCCVELHLHFHTPS